MTDIVKLLREAAERLKADGHDIFCDGLFAAADELEASAEWALCRWLAEDEKREQQTLHYEGYPGWRGTLFGADVVAQNGETRAAAIRAALKAWEDRK